MGGRGGNCDFTFHNRIVCARAKEGAGQGRCQTAYAAPKRVAAAASACKRPSSLRYCSFFSLLKRGGWTGSFPGTKRLNSHLDLDRCPNLDFEPKDRVGIVFMRKAAESAETNRYMLPLLYPEPNESFDPEITVSPTGTMCAVPRGPRRGESVCRSGIGWDEVGLCNMVCTVHIVVRGP
jgi:hypothetical protein